MLRHETLKIKDGIIKNENDKNETPIKRNVIGITCIVIVILFWVAGANATECLQPNLPNPSFNLYETLGITLFTNPLIKEKTFEKPRWIYINRGVTNSHNYGNSFTRFNHTPYGFQLSGRSRINYPNYGPVWE